MPSPFPGMNPYLESPICWRDFHTQFIVSLRNALGRVLPPGYLPMVEESLYILPTDAPDASIFAVADAAVIDRRVMPEPAPHGGASGPTASLVEPAPVRARIPWTTRFQRIPRVEIQDRASRRVVTILEMLSPANKAGGSTREQYMRKREVILGGASHFVELDFLRVGGRMPMEGVYDSDYCVMVSRVGDRPDVDTWPIQLREPLPRIPIPVDEGVPDVPVDLMSLLHAVYDNAGYAGFVYDHDPVPPLHPADRDWAAACIAAGRAATSS